MKNDMMKETALARRYTIKDKTKRHTTKNKGQGSIGGLHGISPGVEGPKSVFSGLF